MVAPHVTTRPTNTDVDEVRARTRIVIANANIFFPGSRPGCDWPFFRSPPAFHRLFFMSPFAGDIGARAGSLKWTAQIPRKAHRWSLGRGSKCCGGASNVEAEQRERLLLMPPPRQEKLERSLILGDPGKRTQARSSSGVVFNFVDLRSRIFSLDGGDVDQKLRIRLLSISHCP